MAEEKKITSIDDFVKKRASSLEKDEENLLSHYLGVTDPLKKQEFQSGEFLGLKGGVDKLASQMYSTADVLDTFHEENKDAKKPASPEDARIHALETLVYKNLKNLPEHESAQRWSKHIKTLKEKGGFHDHEDKERTLIEMAQDVFGWDLNNDKELYGTLSSFLDAASKGDGTTYRAALRDIRDHTEKNFLQSYQAKLTNKIENDSLLRSKASAYFAKKTLDDHKHTLSDVKEYFDKSFVKHLQDYHTLTQLKRPEADPDKQIGKLGYVSVDKASNDDTYKKAS